MLFTIVGGDVLLFQFNFQVVDRGMSFCHDDLWRDCVPSVSVMRPGLKLKIVGLSHKRWNAQYLLSLSTIPSYPTGYCCCYPDISASHLYPSSKLCIVYNKRYLVKEFSRNDKREEAKKDYNLIYFKCTGGVYSKALVTQNGTEIGNSCQHFLCFPLHISHGASDLSWTWHVMPDYFIDKVSSGWTG